MDGDDVDALAAHRLEHGLQLLFIHREIPVDHSLLVAAGECSPGIDAHLVAHFDAMHLGLAADDDLHHAIAALRLRAEHLFDGTGGDAAWRRDLTRKSARRRRLSSTNLTDAVINRLDASGESARISHAADVHEVDLG